MSESIVSVLIAVLSLAGLVISLYFTLAYYGRVKKSRWIPEILCAREGSSCVTVLQTPYARLFGVPNSLLGLVYYSIVSIAFGTDFGALWGWGHDLEQLLFFFTVYALSFFTVIVSGYLTYALRRRLRIDCPLCYAGHAINLAIFLIIFLVFR